MTRYETRGPLAPDRTFACPPPLFAGNMLRMEIPHQSAYVRLGVAQDLAIA